MTDDDTLEARLKSKLESGEISNDEYQKLRAKFEKLGMLHSSKRSQSNRQSVTTDGLTRIKGGKVNGSVNVHGRAEVESTLECTRLFISGSVHVKGDLVVLGKSSISGELVVDGVSKFMDKVSVSGRINSKDDMYSLTKTTFSGRTKINGNLVTEGPILLAGKTDLGSIKSTGSVKLSGRTNLDEDLISDSIEVSSGKIHVGGSIKANQVLIFEQYLRESKPEKPEDDVADDTITGLVSNVVNVVFPTLLNSIKGLTNISPSLMEVNGNIEGSIVKLSYTTVHGDVIADIVEVGPNVTVGGTIRYRETADLPSNNIFRVEKI